VLKGWGGEGLLASYEVERRQVGERNVGASRYATIGRRTWRAAWRPEIGEKTPAGQAARENLGRIADVEQRKTNEMTGAELGYRYLGSPVIAEEPGGPEQPLMEYRPTSWPGARLPHVRLADGRPVQDLIPADGFTVLRLGGAAADAGLQQALARFGAPAAVLDIGDEAPREVYGCDLILVRPDLHVVWRGNAPPEDPAALAAKATGH
jgi:hypothetical protein